MAHGQGNAEIREDGGAPTLTCNHEAPIVAIRNAWRDCDQRPGRNGTTIQDDIMYTLQASQQHAIAHAQTCFKVRCGCEGGGKGYMGQEEAAFTLATGIDQHLFHQMAVRRLTPVECERLQGFPDGYTAIPWKKKTAEECPDGPRYKALGNSWAVPVVRWIFRRIDAKVRADDTF